MNQKLGEKSDIFVSFLHNRYSARKCHGEQLKQVQQSINPRN